MREYDEEQDGQRRSIVPGLLAAGAAAVIASTLVGRQQRAASDSVSLTGRVALVTGGSRGLGYLIARELGNEGCRVAICARDAAELARARDDLAARGVEAIAVPCDVGDQTAVAHMVETVTRQLGSVDILVNNAGVIQVGPLDSMTVQDFHEALDVMYWGVVYPTLAVLPAMRARKSGRIVNITSIGGKVSVPHLLPYVSAKFAATGFSEGLRAELASEGISVTTITPGLMRTGSYLNARFAGRHRAEFAWFGLASTLPGLTMDAERAARQIVQAAKRGDAERVLTVPATLLAKLQGLAPGLMAGLLGLTNRILLPPSSPDDSPKISGHEAQERLHSPLFKAATTFGRSAADRFHEHPGPGPGAAPGANSGPNAAGNGHTPTGQNGYSG